MNPTTMSGLGAILSSASQGFTQGLKNAPVLAFNEAQRAQTLRGYERTNQEQDILATPGQEGETDVQRLERLAALADEAKRGDLSARLRGEASKTKQALTQQNIANGAKAIMVGKFDVAVKHLNAAGTLGNIQSIAQKEPGLYGVTWIDDAGQPQTTDVNYQMLAALAADPGELDRWISSAGAAQDKAEKDRADRELRERIQLERERHNKATEAFAAWKAKNGGSGTGGGSGKLTDYQIRLKWATSPEGLANFKGDMGQAQQWAANPGGVQQTANAMYRMAGQAATGYFTPEDLGRIMSSFTQNPLPAVRPGGTEPAPPGVQSPGGPAATRSGRLEGYGAKPVPNKPGVYEDARGRHFKEEGGRVLQWSPSANKWVDITDRLQ